MSFSRITNEIPQCFRDFPSGKTVICANISPLKHYSGNPNGFAEDLAWPDPQ